MTFVALLPFVFVLPFQLTLQKFVGFEIEAPRSHQFTADNKQ